MADFFSAVSHELKTPITVLKGQLGGMLDGIGVYADRDKYLARSLTVANQMESLVQELLTVSRMADMSQGLRCLIDHASAGKYQQLTVFRRILKRKIAS